MPTVKLVNVTRTDVQTWSPTDLHCPACGTKNTFKRQAGFTWGDTFNICADCGEYFTYQSLSRDNPRLGYSQILDAVRNAPSVEVAD